jgi:hypothetical protein
VVAEPSAMVNWDCSFCSNDSIERRGAQTKRATKNSSAGRHLQSRHAAALELDPNKQAFTLRQRVSVVGAEGPAGLIFVPGAANLHQFFLCGEC